MNKEKIKELAYKISNIREDDFIDQQSLMDVQKIIEDKMIGQDVIVKLLEKKGIMRLFKLQNHQQQSMREMAAKLMCELVYQNEGTQITICENLEFTPINGVVTINQQIPMSIIKKYQERLILVLDQLKEKEFILNFTNKNQKYWCYPKFQTQNEYGFNNQFPDP